MNSPPRDSSVPSGWLRDPAGRGRLPVAPLGQGGLLRHPRGERASLVAPRGQAGFTLIEIMIVMTIMGILVTLAEPTYHTQIVKARETSLRKSLFVMRDVIDQYAADQGRYPDTLQALVDQGYVRALPVDPFTRAGDTWIEVMEDTADGEETPGVFDLHSGSNLVAVDGTAYNTW